ncbi:alpha/beta fold hydrolase [Arthrobacter monumenti]
MLKSKFTKRSIDVDGVRMNIHSGGTKGPAFVLVHGIGASHRYFLPLARMLAKKGTVHILDLPGFGSTPTPNRAFDIADFASVAVKALKALQIGPAILVGHSMGAQVTAEMARQQHDAAAAVVLLGPTAEEGERTLGAQALRLMRNSARASLKSQLVVAFDYLRCGPQWFANTMPALLSYPTEENIAALGMPLLLVAGARDPVAPERWLQKLAGSCIDGRIDRVAGEPHAVMYTDPTAVARLCLQMHAPTAM